jgi:hypothetical protein
MPLLNYGFKRDYVMIQQIKKILELKGGVIIQRKKTMIVLNIGKIEQ